MGRKLGRPDKLTTVQIAHARALLDAGKDGRTVARNFGVARSTLNAILKAVMWSEWPSEYASDKDQALGSGPSTKYLWFSSALKLTSALNCVLAEISRN